MRPHTKASTLAELRRILKPGGRVILSVHHPIIYKLTYPSADYFAIAQYSEEYTLNNGQSMVLTYWRTAHGSAKAEPHTERQT